MTEYTKISEHPSAMKHTLYVWGSCLMWQLHLSIFARYTHAPPIHTGQVRMDSAQVTEGSDWDIQEDNAIDPGPEEPSHAGETLGAAQGGGPETFWPHQ